MKYSSSNKPLVCMLTQSNCYKGTRKMTVKGVLWHSTGANNPTLKRYVQPSDTKPAADTYSKAKWLEILGKNAYNNDFNHIDRDAGLNCWIGKLADGSVTTIQTLPWDYRPWGCGSGSKGSCNDGWIQFEICEDGLTDKTYFNKVYTEACEITAYLCKMFNIDPKGTVTHNGVKVPTILCHADSHKLGLGSNHGDVNHWFPKHGKSMDTVRNDVAKLIGSNTTTTTPTTSTTTVKTYKVVTPINRYSTSADAIAQTNAKSEKLAAGTYYVYTKYPDGYKGVYNVTTDKTGTSAGSWINPKENVIKESTTTTTQKLYRVRKSKDDAKSQVGAYSVLQNAIDACQKAGNGYHVFDWDYKIVYSYKAPQTEKPVEKPVETPKEPEKVVAVYDLDYKDKVKIVDKTIKRNNTDCVKAIKKILTNNTSFDVNIVKAFFSIAPKYGIDPMMAVSQSILETGWFNYKGSAVTADQHNYCGLGVTSTGVKGASFTTIDDGVTAQLQHLFAYGCKDVVPSGDKILDPRFSLVTRGVATYWQQLAGRWACPGYDTKTYDTPQKAMEAGNTYGQKILALCKTLESVTVNNEDIEKYFPTKVEPETPEQPQEKPVETNKPEKPKPQEPEVVEPEKDDNTTEVPSGGIVELIINCLKKLIQLIIGLFNKNKGE